MTIQLELWHLISMLIAFFGCVAGFGKILFAQFDSQLDQRFAAQERSRDVAQQHWAQRFDALQKAAESEREEWRRVERELLKLMASLPLDYVRREDWVRNQTVLESKIDGLALRIENLTLRQQG
jgi:hypothetical protein